ncbi:anti-sigma factor [Jidongwangia harbinensis]|uniref:anti-sigma factor n=1 Tax=Jidongwangia harbinensis TaxID=2878561 RepID=UPI001CD94126|nr:anti-sigma factor [Jidongwangia harbinensis]MCA2217295.1 anti-sigma factor [Jidongwangia harbinensis]
MQHLDPDRLVLLAFSDSPADDEAVHLSECAGCRAEIDALKHVTELGSETQELRDLPPPPDRVWTGIAAEVAKAEAAPAPVVDLTAVRRSGRRRMPRWAGPVVSAAAAAVLAVAGTVTVIRWMDRPAAPDVTASATLEPLKGVPDTARGDARVLSGAALEVDVRNLPLTPGHYEIWLIDPEDITKMQAIGAVPQGTDAVQLPIPPGTDLNRYRLVDVSAEPNDGNSAHSGNSLLRGTLTS